MKLAPCLILAAAIASTMSSPTPVLLKKLKLASGLKLLGGGAKKGDDDCVHETVRDVQVIHEKPVVKEVIREVPVTILREEPYERIVNVDRPYDVSISTSSNSSPILTENSNR